MPSSNFRDVNASVSVSGSDGAILDGANPSIKATVKSLTNSNPIAVAITDNNGNQISTFGGGTQYTEGDADTSITGTAVMWEDASDTLRPVSSAKPLPVEVKNGSIQVTGTFWQATQPVSLASVPSHDVTNSGTFPVQVTSMPTTVVSATDLDIRNLTSSDVVTVTGGAGQTADVKVTLDGESVAVTGNFYPATQPVSLASVPSHDVTNAGTFAVQQSTYSNSSVTSVAASATSVQLLPSTPGRRGAYFYNDSSATAYLKLGTTASTSSFTIAMAANSFYELPYPCYTGRIDCIWSSATGNMRITEIT